MKSDYQQLIDQVTAAAYRSLWRGAGVLQRDRKQDVLSSVCAVHGRHHSSQFPTTLHAGAKVREN